MTHRATLSFSLVLGSYYVTVVCVLERLFVRFVIKELMNTIIEHWTALDNFCSVRWPRMITLCTVLRPVRSLLVVHEGRSYMRHTTLKMFINYK